MHLRPWAEAALVATLCVLAYLVSRRYPTQVAAWCRRLGERGVSPYVLVAALLPVVFRIALLPWLPPPRPQVHDEFGHLLVADTLLAGRLANPPHPLRRHLETIYVLQQPTYSSIYPIGQGLILSVGRFVTGEPWPGVLLAVALMCGAISWMLFGCLPPRWAAVGSLLAAVKFGLAERWVDSYWGGAFGAFGGALVFGAICRFDGAPRRMAALAGLGWSVVWFTRPFESLLLGLMTWGLMAAVALGNRKRWKDWVLPALILCAIQIGAGVVSALHNRAVTGSYSMMPYHLSRVVQGVPQSFLWQAPVAEPTLEFAELREMYAWQRAAKDRLDAAPAQQALLLLQEAWRFFISPWYSAPLLALLAALNDRNVRVAAGVVALGLGASALFPFFVAHYVAAYTCVMCFLILRGLMEMWRWSVATWRFGPWLALFLMLGGFVAGLRIVPIRPILGLASAASPQERDQVASWLMARGNGHVVFVRYGNDHPFHDEWVYNAADIDASGIVWCRTLGPASDLAVRRYYPDRQMWMVTLDADAVRVSRYDRTPRAGGAAEESLVESDVLWVLPRTGT